MELIPLVYIKNRKINTEMNGNQISLDEILTQFKEEKIYYFDVDGIEKDKPNLCTYQRIPEKENAWIDTGPRDLGDVMDGVMAGAKSITIRKSLWPKLEINKIKEMTENEIFIAFDPTNENIHTNPISKDFDGFVLFLKKEDIEKKFGMNNQIKRMAMTKKVYAYETDPNKIQYWKNLNVTGLIVNLVKIKEFKNHGL
jgi:uncharacterized protein related to proFAR isomerase